MPGGGLPVVNGRDVVRALTRAGFEVDRIVGSHHVLVHPNDPRRLVTVPVHGGDVSRGLMKQILKQAGMSEKQFRQLI